MVMMKLETYNYLLHQLSIHAQHIHHQLVIHAQHIARIC